MRYALIALSLLLGTATPAISQVSVSVSVPGVSIGIHLPLYPELVLVPGYPVYYAPLVRANYFFYDGLYWVYQDDNWYSSAWYNGPWEFVQPDYVPLFVLRVPVRYYVNPPVFFFGWYMEAPPRWDHHWGHRWTQHHHGWDRWDRRVVYAPAPLPVYQRHYAGDRYPRAEYQQVIRREHYRYQPRDSVVRERDQQRASPRVREHAQPAGSPGRPDLPRAQQSPRQRDAVQRPETGQVQPGGTVAGEPRLQPRPDMNRRAPTPQGGPPAPRAEQAPREREDMQRTARTEAPPQQRIPAMHEPQQQQQQQQRQEAGPRAQTAPPDQAPRAQQAPGPQQARERGPQVRNDFNQPRTAPERRQGPGQERGQAREGDRGQGRG